MFRLRQVALVAHDLEPVVAELGETLGVEICFRDPGVGVFGLHNALMPIGDTFLEVVAPQEDGTTAGRFLDRREGDGGYMLIFQTDDLDEARQRVADNDVRVVWRHDGDDMAGTHLHPKDMPGAIISIDWADPEDHWEWAGPDWRDHVRTELSGEIVGAEIQTERPEELTDLYSRVLGPECQSVRFVPIGDGRPEGLGGFDVRVTDRARAGEQHLVCGTRINFV